MARMPASEFANGELLIAADDNCVDVFHQMYDRGFRAPLAWFGVKTRTKRDEVEVSFGFAADPAGPVYAEGLELSNFLLAFTLPLTEEPQLRALFSELAARAGRTAP